MKFSDLTLLPDGTFELEKGHTERKPRNRDVFVLQYGCIETQLALKGEDNAEFFLPSPLEDSSLTTIQVAADGLYTDKDGVMYKSEDGMTQKVTRRTIQVVRSMSIGQKLMIVEEKDGNSTQLPTVPLESTLSHLVVVDEDNLSAKPRCDRCRESKKRCNESRPCQHCKDADIGVEDCVNERYGTICIIKLMDVLTTAVSMVEKKYLMMAESLDPTQICGPWQLCRIPQPMPKVQQKFDDSNISVYGVPDIREDSGDTLIVFSTGLLSVTRLQEALGIFNLDLRVGTDILCPTQHEIEVRGHTRVQVRARERFLAVALDATRTGWKSTIECYWSFAKAAGLEKALVDGLEESEDEGFLIVERDTT